MAFLNSKITIIFYDSRDADKKESKFHYEGGIDEFVKFLDKSKKSLILDKNDNTYIFEDLVLNLKTNEILGKEIKVDDKEYFLMPETDIQGIIEK